MKRILFCGLVLSLTLLSACADKEERADGSTEVKLVMKGEFNRLPQGVEQSAQTENHTYNLLLKVTAPDLSEPLIFLNPNYILGSEWTVLIPNGTARTFELLVYVVYDISSYNYFNFSLYIPANPPEERTYDLTGSPLEVSIPVTYSEMGYLSAGGGGMIGWSKVKSGMKVSNAITYPGLVMQTPSGKVYVPPCYGILLRAYLIDPEFPGLVLGPALIDMGAGETPGYYYLGGIPVNRTYQVLVTNPEMGWQGKSDFFTLPNEPGAELHRSIYLTGYQPLNVSPRHFPVKDGDTTFQRSLDISGGWGGEYYVYNTQISSATVTATDSVATYQVIASLGDGGSDTVYIYDNCDSSYVTATAWWYKAPQISSVWPNPVCPNSPPTTMYIYSTWENFDILERDSKWSEIFFDGTYHAPEGGGYGEGDHIWFTAPSKPKGTYKLVLRNRRNNPQLPDFQGWADAIRVDYNVAGCLW